MYIWFPYCTTVNTSIYHINAFLLSLLCVFLAQVIIRKRHSMLLWMCVRCFHRLFRKASMALVLPQQCIGRTSHFSFYKKKVIVPYTSLFHLSQSLSHSDSHLRSHTHTYTDTHTDTNTHAYTQKHTERSILQLHCKSMSLPLSFPVRCEL